MLYTQLVRLWKGHMHVWEHLFHERETLLSVADRLINYTWSSIWKYLQIQTCLNLFHFTRETEKIQFDITWYYVKRITRSSTIEGRIQTVTQLESVARNLQNNLRAALAIRQSVVALRNCVCLWIKVRNLNSPGKWTMSLRTIKDRTSLIAKGYGAALCHSFTCKCCHMIKLWTNYCSAC